MATANAQQGEARESYASACGMRCAAMWCAYTFRQAGMLGVNGVPAA